MTNKNLKIFAFCIVFLIFAFSFLILWQRGKRNTSTSLDSFAQCLKDKNVIMYGAYWCPHCQNQKKLFGSSFQYIPYVECTEDVQKCQEKEIKRYPTWIFEDGQRIEGEVSLEKLAQDSGCKF